MKWVVGVTTAPRPLPTLRRAITSLERAGFAEAQVFNDPDRHGVWPNWLRAVRSLLEQSPRADLLLVCQDDIVLCRNLRQYLERTLWAGRRVALWSPYCPGPYRQPSRGWHRQRRGWLLVGALCWVLPRHAAEAAVRDLGNVRARSRIDARLGKWAAETNRTVWYHTPSLVQHTGIGNSALGDKLEGELRRAVDFIGEEQTP